MIEIKGRKIALIGGSGFIGHNLALQLKEGGCRRGDHRQSSGQ